MPILRSEDIDCPSSIEIAHSVGNDLAAQTGQEIWQTIKLNLVSGARQFDETCLLCRYPVDEMANLIKLVNDLIDGRRQEFYFEPAEPSFELQLSGTDDGGIKIGVWIDSGNASSGFYRWDAAGIRFFTTAANLVMFKNELEQEFLSQANSL